MSAALYRDASILHQPILISVAENDPSSPVRTGSYKNSAMVISALLEPVLTGDFKSFATVISALLEPVLTGDFKSFAMVISALLEPVLTGDLRHSSQHTGEAIRASGSHHAFVLNQNLPAIGRRQRVAQSAANYIM